MKLVGLTLFGVGYVLGSKAGRERYDQLRALARSTAGKLEDVSTESRLSVYTDRLEPFARPPEIQVAGRRRSTNGTGARARTSDV